MVLVLRPRLAWYVTTSPRRRQRQLLAAGFNVGIDRLHPQLHSAARLDGVAILDLEALPLDVLHLIEAEEVDGIRRVRVLIADVAVLQLLDGELAGQVELERPAPC